MGRTNRSDTVQRHADCFPRDRFRGTLGVNTGLEGANMGMIGRSSVVVLWVVFLLAVGTTFAKNKTSTDKGVHKDWKGFIDELEIVAPIQLAPFTHLVVLPLSTDKTPLPDHDDNSYAPTSTVLSRATHLFVDGAQHKTEGRLKVSFAEQPPAADASKGVLLFRGQVTEMNPGSRAERYWVGFGAGKSRVEISGEIVDAETGTPLFRFTHARASSIGAFGGDYTKFLSDDTRKVGEDIGKMLLEF
jgi:hypothetical protein